MKCRDCKFSDEWRDDDDLGFCRRYPPTVCAFDDGEDSLVYLERSPEVASSDWCGEYAERE